MSQPELHPSYELFDPNAYGTFAMGDVDVRGRTVQLHYVLRGKLGGQRSFTETIHFPRAFDRENESQVRPVLRLLQDVAATSYYKLAAPPSVELSVESGGKERRQFLTSLYRHGLAEFAHSNGIKVAPKFKGNKPKIDAAPIKAGNPRRVLLPFGGGKDSLLSLELLRAAGFDVTLLVAGPNPVAEHLARQTEYPLVLVERHLDASIGRLNALGALNGHVPVTAIVSMIAVLTAMQLDCSAVVMSNERSANTGTLLSNGEVNHQYSKGLAFETALRAELARLSVGIEYFSLLRPMSELHICREFAARRRHLDGFVSCNKNFRRNAPPTKPSWCLKCSKCHFVHLAFAPYLDPRVAEQIFGGNPLDDLENLESYAELLEVGTSTRPFDCVGGREEVQFAFEELVSMSPHKEWAVVRHYQDRWVYRLPKLEGEQEHFELTHEHHVPERFQGALDALR